MKFFAEFCFFIIGKIIEKSLVTDLNRKWRRTFTASDPESIQKIFQKKNLARKQQKNTEKIMAQRATGRA